ncbi:MAG: IS1/IS1595 family N-terminal zinc-binding domain-containing protein [Gammaproteobacteria bacterium]
MRIPVLYRCCKSDNVVKRGKTENGKQRYRCMESECARQTFLLDYDYRGCLPEVKEAILDMAMNSSGI